VSQPTLMTPLKPYPLATWFRTFRE